MKKLVLIFFVVFTSTFVNAQAFIDDVFNQYSGKPGFTSVMISPQLFKLVSTINKSDPELQGITEKLSSLKILVSEGKSTGFTNVIREKMTKDDYINIMEVIQGTQKVNFYVKQTGEVITDLILLAIDDSEEVLLSIKGTFVLNDLANLGKSNSILSGDDHLSLLKSLENN
jgi:hypothetical protein